MHITFEQLPNAVAQLLNKLDNIEQILLEKSNQPPAQTDQWFNLTELCEYLPDKPAKQTVYSWVHSSYVPSHRKGKKLYFLKSEIDRWLKTGRRKTLAEIQNNLDIHIHRQDKKGVGYGK